MLLIDQIKNALIIDKLLSQVNHRFALNSFRIPFVLASNDDETNRLLSDTVCQHAFAALYCMGSRAFSRLLTNAKQNTVPVHGNKGRISEQTRKIRDDVEPLLYTYFKE
jgi:hypothetical protein